MQRFYDLGFFLIIFSIGLYIGDYLSDADGSSPIVIELLFGVSIIGVCLLIDMYREWCNIRNKKKPS